MYHRIQIYIPITMIYSIFKYIIHTTAVPSGLPFLNCILSTNFIMNVDDSELRINLKSIKYKKNTIYIM